MLLLAPLILKRYKLAMILYIVIAGKLRNNFRMGDTLRYTILVIAFFLSPFSYCVEAPHYSC